MAIEKKSTQTCSDCRKRTGPAACLGLGIIAWQCAGCGICHTQNQNSANNHRLVYKQLVIINSLVDNFRIEKSKLKKCMKDKKFNELKNKDRSITPSGSYKCSLEKSLFL